MLSASYYAFLIFQYATSTMHKSNKRVENADLGIQGLHKPYVVGKSHLLGRATGGPWLLPAARAGPAAPPCGQSRNWGLLGTAGTVGRRRRAAGGTLGKSSGWVMETVKNRLHHSSNFVTRLKSTIFLIFFFHFRLLPTAKWDMKASFKISCCEEHMSFCVCVYTTCTVHIYLQCIYISIYAYVCTYSDIYLGPYFKHWQFNMTNIYGKVSLFLFYKLITEAWRD